MKELIFEIVDYVGYLIILIMLCYLGYNIIINDNQDIEAEKLQLEIQHLKYQVGIDSLRYDLELNFYERRKAK